MHARMQVEQPAGMAPSSNGVAAQKSPNHIPKAESIPTAPPSPAPGPGFPKSESLTSSPDMHQHVGGPPMASTTTDRLSHLLCTARMPVSLLLPSCTGLHANAQCPPVAGWHLSQRCEGASKHE